MEVGKTGRALKRVLAVGNASPLEVIQLDISLNTL